MSCRPGTQPGPVGVREQAVALPCCVRQQAWSQEPLPHGRCPAHCLESQSESRAGRQVLLARNVPVAYCS